MPYALLGEVSVGEMHRRWRRGLVTLQPLWVRPRLQPLQIPIINFTHGRKAGFERNTERCASVNQVSVASEGTQKAVSLAFTLGFTLGVTLSLRSNSLDLRSEPIYARFTLAVTLDLRIDNERNEERNAERNTERSKWHNEPRA